MKDRLYGMTSMFRARYRMLTSKRARKALKDALDEFCVVVKEDLTDHSRVDVARALHVKTDEILASDQARDPDSARIRCTAGCHFCCRQIVAITSAEAELLVDVAEQRGLPLDEATLIRQTPYTDDTWTRQTPTDQACVFLGSDGRCQVYADRPLSCRKYFSASEPELCDLTRHPKGQVLVWHSLQAETLTTAAFTEMTMGFMPAQLLAALTRKKGSQ